MTNTMDRRTFCATLAAAPLPSLAWAGPADTAVAALAALEQAGGGRLGVCVLDVASGRHFGRRMEERFALCSTFKMPLAAAVLAAADQGRLPLDRRLPITEADMVAHAPVTRAMLPAGGMSVGDLARAAQRTSDNVAANLLVRALGGKDAFNAFLRAQGDSVTRLDRLEPDMNAVDSAVGDLRDTTAPLAMARLAATLLTGPTLRPESRTLLIQWMIDTDTGLKRLRAGLPKHWRAGDKTGTRAGGRLPHQYNDVAIAWPSRRRPVVIAAYYEAATIGEDMRAQDEAVLAEAGRIAAQWISSRRR